MTALRWIVAAVRAAGWAPMLVFLVHLLAWFGLGLYRVFPPFDVGMHLAGGAAIAFFFWRGLGLREAKAVLGDLTTVGVALLTFFAVGTSTVIWELFEWITDTYLGTRTQAGLEDTLLDMFLGLVGGAVVVLLATSGGGPHDPR